MWNQENKSHDVDSLGRSGIDTSHEVEAVHRLGSLGYQTGPSDTLLKLTGRVMNGDMILDET